MRRLSPGKRRIVRGYRANDDEHKDVAALAKLLDCSQSDAIHVAVRRVLNPLPADPSQGR